MCEYLELLFVDEHWLEFIDRPWNRNIVLSGRIQSQMSNIYSRAAMYACGRGSVIITPTDISVGRGFIRVLSCAAVVIVMNGRVGRRIRDIVVDAILQGVQRCQRYVPWQHKHCSLLAVQEQPPSAHGCNRL